MVIGLEKKLWLFGKVDEVPVAVTSAIYSANPKQVH
jgi:hypothetical protein